MDQRSSCTGKHPCTDAGVIQFSSAKRTTSPLPFAARKGLWRYQLLGSESDNEDQDDSTEAQRNGGTGFIRLVEQKITNFFRVRPKPKVRSRGHRNLNHRKETTERTIRHKSITSSEGVHQTPKLTITKQNEDDRLNGSLRLESWKQLTDVFKSLNCRDGCDFGSTYFHTICVECSLLWVRSDRSIN
jgi:hypothetical protein